MGIGCPIVSYDNGHVADLGEGLLRCIVGQLVRDETDSVILAIQGDVLADLVTLEVGDTTISFARVKRADTVTELSGWEIAVRATTIDTQALLEAYTIGVT